MALANIFGWNKQDKAQTGAAEQHVEQLISPQKSPQPAERHVERQTSPKKNPQPVVQHVALPISK